MSDPHLAFWELADPPHPRPIEEQGEKPAEHMPQNAGWGINSVSPYIPTRVVRRQLLR